MVRITPITVMSFGFFLLSQFVMPYQNWHKQEKGKKNIAKLENMDVLNDRPTIRHH